MTAADSRSDPLALLDDYDFELPPRAIAQTATQERDAARMLVLDRASGAIVDPAGDPRVRDLPAWLRPGDLLVVNTTRVLPARLAGRKASGGAAEALLLGRESSSEALADEVVGAPPATRTSEIEAQPAAPSQRRYRALLRCTGRVREGLALRFGEGDTIVAVVVAIHERGEVTLAFDADVDPYRVGSAPLPPYIRRPTAAATAGTGDAEAATRAADLERYQTVYAREPGAVAAPTAGLHFTQSLFEALAARGIERAEVVLHVGAGTFRPLDADALETGRLHAERFELPERTVRAVTQTRARGGRIVAVGTTTTRVLESCVDAAGELVARRGETTLFLRPGGPPIRVVDALFTNFHLPRSSLLLLVAAFIGRKPLLDAYAHALARGYRFYSYGDAMLVLPDARQEASMRGERP